MSAITHSTGTITPRVVLGWEASRRARSLVHEVLGRPDPDITLRPAGVRSGTLRLLFATGAEAAAAASVFATAQTLTITDPDVAQVSMSFVVAEGDIVVQLDPETRRLWMLSAPFQEVVP